jgi:hypothetical protein
VDKWAHLCHTEPAHSTKAAGREVAEREPSVPGSPPQEQCICSNSQLAEQKTGTGLHLPENETKHRVAQVVERAQLPDRGQREKPLVLEEVRCEGLRQIACESDGKVDSKKAPVSSIAQQAGRRIDRVVMITRLGGNEQDDDRGEDKHSRR